MTFDVKSIVPRINEMKPHSCLWCGQNMLSIPGSTKAIYCYSNGHIHSSEEPMYLCVRDIDIEHKVTLFNHNGSKSRKGMVKLLPEISACKICNDNPPEPYCKECNRASPKW